MYISEPAGPMDGHTAAGGPLPQEGDPLQDLPPPLGKLH